MQNIAPQNKQRGFTLVIVLIFIVALSLIAAASMRNVATGERIVANERDRFLSFQGSESAGREAISLITSGKEATLAKGYYAAALPQGGNAEFWRTNSGKAADSSCANTDASKRFDWNSCSAAAGSSYGNSVAPKFVIERLPNVVVTATVTERWFRITTLASGGSSESDVILQVMFTSP